MPIPPCSLPCSLSKFRAHLKSHLFHPGFSKTPSVSPNIMSFSWSLLVRENMPARKALGTSLGQPLSSSSRQLSKTTEPRAPRLLGGRAALNPSPADSKAHQGPRAPPAPCTAAGTPSGSRPPVGPQRVLQAWPLESIGILAAPPAS